jgi:hypothetical protein
MSRRRDLLVETDWLAPHLHDLDLRVLSQWAPDPSLPMEQR